MTRTSKASQHKIQSGQLFTDTNDSQESNESRNEIEIGTISAPDSRAPAPQDETESLPVLNDQAARRLIYAQTTAGFFAADRIVFLYRPTIHTRHVWRVTEEGAIAEPDGIIESTSRSQRPLDLALVALKPDLTPATEQDDPLIVTTAIEVAEHIEGPVAGRIVRILYRIANNRPFYRHPRITVDMDELMDDLGYERTSASEQKYGERRYHDAQNRARVRDVFLALSRVEIRGERDISGSRELYQAPLVSIRGGSYQNKESQDIPLTDLLERGLPSKLHIELGWYDGVRRSDGRLGTNYVLLPQDLSKFQSLPQADYMRTEDLLAEFLWLRYSLQYRKETPLSLTLDVALKHAGITNSNITRARQTLDKALQSLKARGHIVSYSPLPTKRAQSFNVTLQVPPQKSEQLTRSQVIADSQNQESLLANSGSEHLPAFDPPTSNFQQSEKAFDEESIDSIDEIDDGISETGSYLQVLRVGSHSLPAEIAWQSIRMAIHNQLPDAVIQHLSNVQPLWRADPLVNGDIVYILHLGIPSGLRFRLQSEETVLQQIADHLYPQAFDIMFGSPVQAE